MFVNLDFVWLSFWMFKNKCYLVSDFHQMRPGFLIFKNGAQLAKILDNSTVIQNEVKQDLNCFPHAICASLFKVGHALLGLENVTTHTKRIKSSKESQDRESKERG